MFGNNVICRNKGCNEGLYMTDSPVLCDACFRNQVGDAIHEVITMINWAYEKGIEDAIVFTTRGGKVEVN